MYVIIVHTKYIHCNVLSSQFRQGGPPCLRYVRIVVEHCILELLLFFYLSEIKGEHWHLPANVLWVVPAAQVVLSEDAPEPLPLGQAPNHPLHGDESSGARLSGTVQLCHQPTADLSPERQDGLVATAGGCSATGSNPSFLQHVGPVIRNTQVLETCVRLLQVHAGPVRNTRASLVA